MKLKPRIGFVFTSIEGIDADQTRLVEFKKKFIEKMDSPEIESIFVDFTVASYVDASAANRMFSQCDPDVICIVAAVWTPDTTVIKILERLEDIPVILYTTSLSEYTIGLNGAQLISATLKELKIKYRFIFGNIDDNETVKDIFSYGMACTLVKKLKTTRIGLVGGRLSIMTNLTADEYGIKNVFGCTIIPVDFGKLEFFLKNVDAGRIKKKAEDINKIVKNISVDSAVLEESVKYFLAFYDIVKEFELDAIAVNCYPFPYIKAKTCLAASNLNDMGITYACESDVNSAIIMYMMKSITGSSSLNSDLIIEDQKANTLMFSHCGCGPFNCAASPDNIRLEQHFEVKSGMAVYYPVQTEGKDATVVNLVGRENTFRLCVLEGVTQKTPYTDYCGNPVTVKFEMPVKELINCIGNEGFGHHWMVSLDNLSSIFKNFCGLLNIKGLFIQ